MSNSDFPLLPGTSTRPSMHRSVVATAVGAMVLSTLAAAPLAAQRAPTPPPAPLAPVPPTLDGATGWVGLTTVETARGDDGTDVVVGYPIVRAVEPGSPAQAAGLVAGDTILAYNDVDAREDPLGVQRFLHPGTRIVIRARRDGVREFTLTVARRPSRAPASSVVTSTEIMGIPVSPMLQVPVAIAGPLAARRAAPLAGAQLARLNPGLAEMLNVRDSGVLVIDILPGTPALRSGLQPGDVIVRADSLQVASPVDLMRAMRRASDHSVALDVIRRARGHQKIILRW